MKNQFFIFAFLLTISLSAQELFWYDVILDVNGQHTNQFENIVDDYYSNKNFPDGVSMTFSRIPLKGIGFEGTHILSFVSPSSETLAELRTSLNGGEWEDYLDLVRPYVKQVRASAGNVITAYNQDEFNPIGQAWIFKIKSKNVPLFTSAFKTLMKTFDFPGFVGLAQFTHGTSNGENLIIYGTYPDLNSAFRFGPKNEDESKAFSEFSEAVDDISEFSQTWTRAEIKTYN
ncbi:hypothetical protein [Winogradskyella sp. KYW1333]|jgi:hypothetical protein|uniref:hypothetical protein n=1 Tax=unclassified Winogradskyella TaxID=2615021 RepID=UPI000DF2A1FE|nr:hypothetical protein [Winogradskyella sp. KYW1333]RCT55538.1 hypothetical protein DUZ96_04425 [Winogradskyella sp. KYW1333]